MSERPTLTLGLKRQDFLEYYCLKEELVKFCHDNGLPASFKNGSKRIPGKHMVMPLMLIMGTLYDSHEQELNFSNSIDQTELRKFAKSLYHDLCEV